MIDFLNGLVALSNFVLIPAIAYGSQLALGALGVTLIYGILRFSNFAHGALYFLPIYFVTILVGSIWEGVFNLIRGHEISEAFLVTSLLFPLTLPPTIPLW